jgi:hypothetical protein
LGAGIFRILIITEKAEASDLTQRYGVDVSPTNFGGLTNKETFIKQTGLSWQELKDLLYQNLSPQEINSGIAHQFYINKKLDGSKYLNLNEKGEIENLSYLPRQKLRLQNRTRGTGCPKIRVPKSEFKAKRLPETSYRTGYRKVLRPD